MLKKLLNTAKNWRCFLQQRGASVEATKEHLDAQIARLEMRVETENVRVAARTERARQKMKDGDREGARHELVLAKMAAGNAGRFNSMIVQMSAMRDAADNASAMLDVTNAMRMFAASMHMPSASEIEDIFSSVRDRIDDADESTRILSEPLAEVDDADLETELAMLVLDDVAQYPAPADAWGVEERVSIRRSAPLLG